MKRLIIVVFLIFLGVIFSQSSFSKADLVKVDSAVTNALENNDNVRVIVMLKEQQVVKGQIRSLAVQDKRIMQQQVISSLDKNEFKEGHRYSIINGFSGTITKEGLAKLEQDPIVERIIISGVKKAFLQDSVPLINASIIHSLKLNNINITGKDQTICIIDTGINKTHPSLSGKIIAEQCYCSVTDYGSGGCCNDNTPQSNSGLDDNGHGTHVAGIAASNGTITGVAPEANLISIKVMNLSGFTIDDDIVAGLEWCLNNATKYNISVVSMSLGGNLYSNYCNNEPDELIYVSYINNLVANNISVVVSTGNSGSTTSIASPACIYNSTSVGAIIKSNNIWGNSNRNNITNILAPGQYINSTSVYGNYTELSGTSMATPHIAGAIALLQQYKTQEGRTLTPSEIKTFLNQTGVPINDIAGSGYWIPRIDVYEALVSIDEKVPSINYSLSSNIVSVGEESVVINWTANDLFLNNYNLTIKYPNTTVLKFDTGDVELSPTELNITGDYTIEFRADDKNGNINLTIATIESIEYPIVTQNIPINYYNTSNPTITFNCSAEDNRDSLSTISLYHNINGTWLLNQTKSLTGVIDSETFTIVNNVSYGTYLWNCIVYNNESDYDWGENRTFMVDTIAPIVSLSSPTNNSNQSTTSSSKDVTFSFTASDTGGISNCKLYLDGSVDQTIYTSFTSFSKSFSSDDYDLKWKVSCTDIVNHITTTEERIVIIDINIPETTTTNETSTTGGTGGTTGGGGTPSEETPTVTKKETTEKGIDADLTSTVEKEVKGLETEARTFTLDGTTQHTITFDKIGATEVTLTIESSPKTITLKVGESKEVDLDDDKLNDILVTLNKIEDRVLGKLIMKQAVVSIKRLTAIETRTKTNKTGNETVIDQLRDIWENVKDFSKGVVTGKTIFKKQTTATMAGSIAIVVVAIILIIFLIVRFTRKSSKKGILPGEKRANIFIRIKDKILDIIASIFKVISQKSEKIAKKSKEIEEKDKGVLYQKFKKK